MRVSVRFGSAVGFVVLQCFLIGEKVKGGHSHNFLHKKGNEVTEKGGVELTGEGQNDSDSIEGGNEIDDAMLTSKAAKAKCRVRTSTGIPHNNGGLLLVVHKPSLTPTAF